MPLATSYDHSLVILSLLVAIGSAHVALGVAEEIAHSAGRLRTISIQGGAAIMGLAIWAMHYVGMLALRLPFAVRYDGPLVLLSIAVSVMASAVAFGLTGQPTASISRLVLGALAMGGGIAGMHYIGMAAMRMPCRIVWQWPLVILSILIAVAVSGVALASFRYSGHLSGYSKFFAASVMGVAISSMHYVGMAAAQFVNSAALPPDFRGTLNGSFLAGTAIACASLSILALARAGTLISDYINKQAKRLATSEERYRLLFEKCLLGVYRVDPDGVVLDINRAGVELLGYSNREELIGNHLMAQHLNGANGPPQEMNLISKNGSQTPVLHSATSIESSDASPREVQGFFLSIADLKRTEKDLRQAQILAEAGNLAKRQFMTRMSHELRTPLNGILGMTEILMQSNEPEKRLEYLSIVRQCGESLLASIDEILTFANESSPRPESHWEEFVFRTLIDGEVRIVSLKARDQGLAVRCNIDDSCEQRYFSDTVRLRHILKALLSNAVKFTKVGTIGINACSRPSAVGAYPIITISISDTGEGIPNEDQNKIFEPFFEADPSVHKVTNGAGLGLATAKAAVAALHGNIAFVSRVGQGSTFTVELPMRPITSLII